MDLNGWVNSRELSEAIQNQRRHFHWLRGWHFEAIANADTKGRYQVEGEMIRATYGHSIELELDLPTDDIPEALYWPCDPETVSTHMEYGITAGDRKHVHLSKTISNAMEVWSRKDFKACNFRSRYNQSDRRWIHYLESGYYRIPM